MGATLLLKSFVFDLIISVQLFRLGWGGVGGKFCTVAFICQRGRIQRRFSQKVREATRRKFEDGPRRFLLRRGQDFLDGLGEAQAPSVTTLLELC